MFSANESKTHPHQQFSAQDSSYLDRMAFPLLEKNYDLPFFPLPKCTPDAVFPGHAASILPGPNKGPQDAVNGLLKPVHRYCNISNPIGNLYPKDTQYALPHGPFDAPQKKFLIFDQSGDHTRLFVGPSFSPQGPILASKTNGPSDPMASRVDQRFLMKPIDEEKWDENHLTDDGEDEMLEDTDEIDALLYSDSDDEYHDNDEVTSTRQSPFIAIEEGNIKDTSLDCELTASSYDNSPKRQKLPDGKYKKPSFESRANSSCQDDDAESSCRNPYDDDAESDKRENKVKIRRALKILETIVPGLDNKDPVSIIDRAVAYLKSMKTEAEALELGFLVTP